MYYKTSPIFLGLKDKENTFPDSLKTICLDSTDTTKSDRHGGASDQRTIAVQTHEIDTGQQSSKKEPSGGRPKTHTEVIKLTSTAGKK